MKTKTGLVNEPGKYFSPGYSGTPLIKKLGIKENSTVIIINSPKNYSRTLGSLPESISLNKQLKGKSDFIQFFTENKKELTGKFPDLKKHLNPSGSLWISWPKKSSKIDTDLDENIIREIGLKSGLVDVKVCAVDQTWSGLKFVFRLKDR